MLNIPAGAYLLGSGVEGGKGVGQVGRLVIINDGGMVVGTNIESNMQLNAAVNQIATMVVQGSFKPKAMPRGTRINNRPVTPTPDDNKSGQGDELTALDYML
jgi:hypothetical protein